MSPSGDESRFISELLDPQRHRIDGFRCGEPELDEWLHVHAAHAAMMNTARTFVWIESERRPPSVRAYYALAAHLLAREGAPASVARGGPRQIPAILLAKLALSVDLQGQGLGVQVLVDALRRAVHVSRTGAAARIVVVDAINDRAARFYAGFGFTALPGRPLRLVQRISDIAAAL